MQGQYRSSIRFHSLTHVQDLINIIHPTMTTPNTKVSMPTEVRILANDPFCAPYLLVVHRQTRFGRPSQEN
jgi:hypothetical protein